MTVLITYLWSKHIHTDEIKEKRKVCRGLKTFDVVKNDIALTTVEFSLTPFLFCRNCIPVSPNTSKLSKKLILLIL